MVAVESSDDFRAGAHAGQQGRNACRGGLRLRDSDYMPAHKIIIRLAPGRRQFVKSLVFTEGKLPVCPTPPNPPKRKKTCPTRSCFRDDDEIREFLRRNGCWWCLA